MEQEVFNGTGVIEEKIEAMSKKGAYWKYKIVLEGKDNPNTFNFFDYEVGSKVKTGDEVQIFCNENEGTFKGEPVTYKNLKSIFKIDDTKVDSVLSKKSDKELAKEEKEVNGGGRASPSPQPTYKSYSEGARIGMIFNNAVQLCIAECKYTNLDIEKRFTSLKKLLDELEG